MLNRISFIRWQADLTETDEVKISHSVTNFEFLYEPFFVAADNNPPHDERFVGYGYTRNTQVSFILNYIMLLFTKCLMILDVIYPI